MLCRLLWSTRTYEHYLNNALDVFNYKGQTFKVFNWPYVDCYEKLCISRKFNSHLNLHAFFVACKWFEIVLATNQCAMHRTLTLLICACTDHGKCNPCLSKTFQRIQWYERSNIWAGINYLWHSVPLYITRKGSPQKANCGILSASQRTRWGS